MRDKTGQKDQATVGTGGLHAEDPHHAAPRRSTEGNPLRLRERRQDRHGGAVAQRLLRHDASLRGEQKEVLPDGLKHLRSI